MSVPLERLYTHLNNLCNRDNVVISRWHPHGSKKATDLRVIKEYAASVKLADRVGVVCHDQEPLFYDAWKFEDILIAAKIIVPENAPILNDPNLHPLFKDMHLRLLIDNPVNYCDQTLLIHSELNSAEVKKFQKNNYIPIYWWVHGVIAQDWFRYAQHDVELKNFEKFNKTFLIYCRAWTGSRQYRLKFLEEFKNHNLHLYSQINFNPYDDGHHFSELTDSSDLDKYFAHNTATSSASADYSAEDYKNCAVELVLETIYESSRIHLTEKTCRPIACGKPFMLAAGPGSLEVLRRYGFKTFSPWINEQYDLEPDCDRRRRMIVSEMSRLSQLPHNSAIWRELHQIAQENKQHFFSERFVDQLFTEFKTNFESAYQQLTFNGTWLKNCESQIVPRLNDPTLKAQVIKFFNSCQ